jgi:outer membrane cobalamin receptor
MSGVVRFARVLAALAALTATAGAQQYQTTVHARPRRDDGNPVIVVTARELHERGAQNLKEALDLIPEVQIRQGGMGTRLDARGAKQRSILLLIDGVPMDEPYNGAFELSSIPITDIVEIRVQLAPASPLEGPGGDGGIVDVTTLRAVGPRRIEARAVGGSTPYAEGALTGRVPLTRSGELGLRASAGAHFAQPGYPVTNPANDAPAGFFGRDTQEYSALRLEWAHARARVTGDAWYGHRDYFIPPAEDVGSLLQHIIDQHSARTVFGAELGVREWRLAFGAYGMFLSQATDFFGDFTLTRRTATQKLFDARVGVAAQVERAWSWRGVRGLITARLSVDGEGAAIDQTTLPSGAHASTSGRSIWGMAAVGARLTWRWLSVDAAVGALVPFENAGATWPEAKLTITFRPTRFCSLLLIGARKGRLPTIRELYDPIQGNPLLDPELVLHGEAQLQARPHRLLAVRFSGYFRRVDGTIRLDPQQGGGTGNMNARNVNLDTIFVRGFETGADVARDHVLGGGITYVFESAWSSTLGAQPIANFPTHKIDAYLSSTFWARRMGALARVRWVSERLVQNEVAPRYWLVELDAWGRVTDRIRASVRVDNLLNQKYEMLPGLLSLGTTATATIDGVWE